MTTTAPSTTPSAAPATSTRVSTAPATTTGVSAAPYTSVTTPSMPGGGQPRERGIGGFLKDNAGMLIGGVLGAVLMMMTGGSGIMGMLMPLLGALVGGMFMDGGNGLLGGLFGGGSRSNAPGGSGPAAGGPAPVVGVSGPAVGASSPVVGGSSPATTIPTPPPVQQTGIEWGGKLQVRQAGPGTAVINGVNGSGAPTYGPASGTGPGARGPEIAIIEAAAPASSGAASAGPAYRYTGFVRDDKFVVTSIANVIPGTTPPQFAAPITLDSRPGSTAVEMPIAADGTVNFNYAAQPNAGLESAVSQAYTRARNAGTNVTADVSAVTGSGAPANRVQVSLEPVTRNGVTYVTTLTGTRDATGNITFNQLSTVERTPNPSGPPTERPVVNPRTNNTTFDLNPPITAGQIAGTPPKVALNSGTVDTIREAMATRTTQIRELETRNVDARGNDLVAGISTAPTASQSLNALSSRMSAQLTAGGMPQPAAVLVGEAVADYYSQSGNRTGAFNSADFRTNLQTRVAGLSNAQLDAITEEVGKQHNKIGTAINTRPMPAVSAPGGTGPAVSGPATSTQNLTRDRVYTPPAPGAGYTPLPTPNVNPATLGR